MRLSAIAMVAMLSLGFASCSGDDEENGPQTGKTEKTDYGKDGLKGYWMEEPTTQNWMAQGNKACFFSIWTVKEEERGITQAGVMTQNVSLLHIKKRQVAIMGPFHIPSSSKKSRTMPGTSIRCMGLRR